MCGLYACTLPTATKARQLSAVFTFPLFLSLLSLSSPASNHLRRHTKYNFLGQTSPPYGPHSPTSPFSSSPPKSTPVHQPAIMELFPAQPDLSLQISPPSSSPTPSWARRPAEERMDLDFWRRQPPPIEPHISSNNLVTNPSSSSPSWAAAKAAFDLSASNPTISDLHIRSQQLQQFPQHQDLGQLLRPIRGIPLYHHHNAASLPFLQYHHHHLHHQQQPLCDSAAAGASLFMAPRSRFQSRLPTRRNMRAPRMRWTSTLHARFVHAVELLGGHERMYSKFVLYFNCCRL